MILRVESSGRIDHQHVGRPRDCSFARVVRDGARISPFVMLDDLHAGALAPDGKLLYSSSPVRIAGRHDDALALIGKVLAELGDGRSLARAVHTRHQDHRGRGVREIQLPIGLRPIGNDLLFKERDDFLRFADAPCLPRFADLFN